MVGAALLCHFLPTSPKTFGSFLLVVHELSYDSSQTVSILGIARNAAKQQQAIQDRMSETVPNASSILYDY